MTRVSLRTERLLLRPFESTDADDVFAYASDEQWSRYLEPVVPFPYARTDAVDFLERKVGALDHWPFAMVLDRTVIGAIEVRPDRDRHTAELGWACGRPHWGKGLMTETVRAVVGFGFAQLDLERLYARADARNKGSIRVMEKVGMTREALLRQHRLDRYGVAYDEAWYAVLRTDWERAHPAHQG